MSLIIIGLANSFHCRLAASANSLHRPFSQLQHLRKNFIDDLNIACKLHDRRKTATEALRGLRKIPSSAIRHPDGT